MYDESGNNARKGPEQMWLSISGVARNGGRRFVCRNNPLPPSPFLLLPSFVAARSNLLAVTRSATRGKSRWNKRNHFEQVGREYGGGEGGTGGMVARTVAGVSVELSSGTLRFYADSPAERPAIPELMPTGQMFRGFSAELSYPGRARQNVRPHLRWCVYIVYAGPAYGPGCLRTGINKSS